jgi:hypothetical protein
MKGKSVYVMLAAAVLIAHPTYWSACFQEGDRDAVRALVAQH